MLDKTLRLIAICASITILSINPGCIKTENDGTDADRVGCVGIRYTSPVQLPESGEICAEEVTRKADAERLDTHKLLGTAKVVVDSDSRMLEVPETVAQYAGTEFTVAGTPPEIEFAMIPVNPPFMSRFHNQHTSGWWANYCQSVYDPESGVFYTAVGDHGGIDAHLYLAAYDPASRTVTCPTEINDAIGRKRGVYRDGILHGWLDLYQPSYLENRHLWFCTYWSTFPEPTAEEYATGYDGGHIISYDPKTGAYVDYGAPLERASWPYHRVDTRRGMLYAVGCANEFLAWDIEAQKAKWAGYLPDGMKWYNRSIMLDEETGYVYTTNADPDDTELHLIRYDPATNRFDMPGCHMPPDPETGEYIPMRVQTRHRGPDGLIWGITSRGMLFTFSPDSNEIIEKGTCWPGQYRYVCSLERSPGGRYIYYQPQHHHEGAPIIQYDTRTGAKKVIAFLAPFYHKTYGYIPTGAYALKLDDTGGKLFAVWNGAFRDYEPDLGVERFGHPSVMLIHIPESERVE